MKSSQFSFDKDKMKDVLFMSGYHWDNKLNKMVND